MDKRKEFEKTDTFKKCNHWSLSFNEVKQVYFTDDKMYMSYAIAVNAAWMMFLELNDESN